MLVATLNAIHTAADVGKLFSILGYTEDGFPFIEGACTVARWRSFKVVAADRDDVRDGVRELARTFMATSERALAAAVSPARELALAAPRFGQEGITRILVISLDRPSTFAVQQLARLAPNDSSTALGHALSVAAVLSGEEVGQRVFATFKTNLERMAASIDRRRPADDRRMVALLALSRILFLYFVQGKGWLDGRPDYLKSQLDATLARRRNFHRTILDPLFFDTLNRPPAQRSRRVNLGVVPYLNGGLFDPHPSELRLGPTCFSNEIWREVFDGMFEHFRFSVREGDEVDAIAPDMLGRVFERLMNSEERHDTGTYYTPASVVRQLVTATIETALMHDLPHHVVRQLIAGEVVSKQHVRSARKALDTMRVLDPAVGSGAFLLEALQVLSRMRLALEPREDPRIRLQLRKDILKENLMGIDLNPVAVRLAELRLWLAVVADDPTTEVESVTPLPNLDGVVRQGDTLLDPLGAARSFSSNTTFFSTEVAQSLREARQALFDSRGQDHHSSALELRRSEMDIARKLLDSAHKRMAHERNDLNASARSRDLFGKRAGLSATQRQRLHTLKHIRREVDRARRQLADGSLPFFSFEVHAPDVLSSGGFTAVVGNPPWVRAEHLSQRQRTALRERFRWWRAGGQRGFGHLPDLSVAFLERCIELTRQGGAVGLLLPSKLTSAGYGERARQSVVHETSITYVHRVSDREAARFGATTYPLAIVVKKEPAHRKHRVRLGFDGTATVDQRSLAVPGPWILLPRRAREALEEFRSAGMPLGDVAPPMLGVKTGADNLYVGRVVDGDDSVAEVAFPGRQVPIERALLKPVLRGRDVRRFRCIPRGVIVWCYDDDVMPIPRLPDHAARYFEQRSGQLRARSDYRGGPVWTVFRTRCMSGNHRIVWPDIAQHPRAVVLDAAGTPSAVPLNTCYVATTADRETALATTAVMNSTWTAALLTASADEARGGYRRINARVARQIPVPDPGPRRAALAQLSKRVHENERHNNEDLDEAVAHALGLSDRARGILRSLADTSC